MAAGPAAAGVAAFSDGAAGRRRAGRLASFVAGEEPWGSWDTGDDWGAGGAGRVSSFGVAATGGACGPEAVGGSAGVLGADAAVGAAGPAVIDGSVALGGAEDEGGEEVAQLPASAAPRQRPKTEGSPDGSEKRVVNMGPAG